MLAIARIFVRELRQMEKTGSGVNTLTAVALTHDGRAALERYTAALRQLLDTAESAQRR
jgi:hypothetical protein